MLLENLASYISLLKLHIYIEDQIFFRMVEKELSEDEDRMLLEQFKHEEKRVGTEDFFENSRKLVHEISSIIKTFLLWFKPLLNYQGRPQKRMLKTWDPSTGCSRRPWREALGTERPSPSGLQRPRILKEKQRAGISFLPFPECNPLRTFYTA